MEESGNIANNVAQAITAALDWSSTPDTRRAAFAYLESFKAGDVRILASTSIILVKKEWSSEIRLQAFKMLQHLVRLRWEELNPMERRNFASIAVDLMSQVADPCEEWALKSQTAALVAEIVRREGPNMLQELFPSVAALSNSGPSQAELVSMMLRWLPEDITVHNEDLEGDRRRLLLRGLTESLPEILPLLYTLLERHFGAAVNEANQQHLDIAKQHAATVTATLNAINAYAEWAPLPDLAKYAIIYGCGCLLTSPDFRLHACEFFKLVSARKRPADAPPDFDSAVRSIFETMMNVSKDFLHKSSLGSGAVDDSEFEFAELICECMVSLGSTNLMCISSDTKTNILFFFLQQMLGYFQHYKLALHCQSLPFWLALMRDLLSKPKAHATGDGAVNSSAGSGQAESEKNNILNLINDDCCGAILDTSFPRLLRKEKVHPETAHSFGPLEMWSDDFEGKGEFGQYRSKLMELIRLVSNHKPIVAATRVSERTIMIIQSLVSSSVPTQDLVILESMQLALENVVVAVFGGSDEFASGSSEIQLALCRIFEGLLQQLLTLQWTEPSFVEVLGHYMHSLGPFLKVYPNAAGPVVNKLFELLTSLPVIVKDPSTNSSRHARLQICTSFIRIAKVADKSLLPHMKGIADMMGQLQNEGRLLRGEHNLLGEAFLIMASAAGVQQQQEVLAWLLEPLSKQWIQQDWQNAYLSDPSGFVRLCADTPLMWSIFHTVTFFERALKRSGIRKNNLQNISAGTPVQPMAPHLTWMLPPLLKLLRAMHSLWSPAVVQSLPGEVKAALTMSDIERISLLGEVNTKAQKAPLGFADGSLTDMSKDSYGEPNEKDIRNWLRGIRDSGYDVVGLSTTVGDAFFRSLDVDSVVQALMENLQSMEYRHLKQLIHLVIIPLIKSCPPELWGTWLEKLLHPILHYAQPSLSSSWSSLLNEGRAKVPDVCNVLGGSDLKVEVMEEKLLRDVTREVCGLLSALASPALNVGLPSLDHSGHITRFDTSSLKDLDVLASSSAVSFLLKHQTLAVPGLHLCLDAFKWTDSEAMAKLCSFCGVIVVLCISTNNGELRDFVSKDLFYAAIQGLALESNAFVSSDLVSLCREIYFYLADRNPAPRQILSTLPCINPQDLAAFEEALAKTASPKEQKQHMKNLLLLGTGNKLKALGAQKSVNVITNVTVRSRAASSTFDTSTEDGDAIGLAAIM
ncbi:protein HASTY 1-like [Chenopodium quinoa]|uniref:protein HASTY 1-like n=1 Tax=Chenopodium quinoa TaxID=63459 RepID=UPI000B78C0D5|nr:protein HASTY 1-like [Chenopodium quinoa]